MMSASHVQPCEAIPAQIIKLSFTDAIAPKNWPVQLLFWPLEDPCLFHDVYSNLKEGLSRLLAEVPVLLGSLNRASSEDARFLAVTILEGASVEFDCEDVSAKQDIPSFEELLHSGFPTTGLKVPLSPKASLDPMVEGSPTLCAKLNRIKGGVVLAFGFSHVVADGLAVSVLTTLWAQHSADAAQGVRFRKYKPVTPDDEIRQRLSTSPSVGADTGLDGFLAVIPSDEGVNYLPRDAAEAYQAKQKQIKVMMGHMALLGERPEPRSFAMWNFTLESLARLKTAASAADTAHPGGGDWISTMDALAGLFWSRVAHIQRQSTRGLRDSTCIFSMSVRHRLQPSVPAAYIGNVFCPVGADCSLAELEAHDDGDAGARGLGAAARSLRRANKNWSQARWDVWLDKIMALSPDQAISMNPVVTLGKQNMHFSDYSQYQLSTTDWGAPLGRTARVRFFRPAHPGGSIGVWVSPRLANGALEVSLLCSDGLRQSLLEDDMFMQYAQFVCNYS